MDVLRLAVSTYARMERCRIGTDDANPNLRTFLSLLAALQVTSEEMHALFFAEHNGPAHRTRTEVDHD